MVKSHIGIIIAISLLGTLAHADVKSSLIKTTSKIIVSFIKNEKALSKKQIIKLSKILKEVKGTKRVGKILGKMRLPNEVLEDTYMRLAVALKRINPKEARQMILDLKGTKGFRTTMRKILGNSPKKTSGHLHELRLAHSAKRNGFRVEAIGEKFSDGIKKMPSDIDVVLRRNNKTIAIEAKNYLSSTNMKPSMIKADMKTLAMRAKQNVNEKVIPIFSITNKPASKKTMNILQKEADKNGVQLVFGNPHEQIEQIKILEEIF